jgi:hypothetical protein
MDVGYVFGVRMILGISVMRCRQEDSRCENILFREIFLNIDVIFLRKIFMF